MGPNCCFNWINRFKRIISICIGVLSMIPWILQSYGAAQIAMYVFSMSARRYEGNGWIDGAPDVSLFLCTVASVVMSALMVFGAIKRIANCIFPWLALHFVVLMYISVTTFCYIVFFFIVGIRESLIEIMFLFILFSVGLTFSWGVVFLYWRSLIIPTQVQPICSEEEQSFKTQNDTKDQVV